MVSGKVRLSVLQVADQPLNALNESTVASPWRRLKTRDSVINAESDRNVTHLETIELLERWKKINRSSFLFQISSILVLMGFFGAQKHFIDYKTLRQLSHLPRFSFPLSHNYKTASHVQMTSTIHTSFEPVTGT
jgi:hypothetical protein